MTNAAHATDESLEIGEFESQLATKLKRLDWRATVALVLAPGCLGSRAEEARERVEAALGIEPKSVARWIADSCGTTDEQLVALNRARDDLLKNRRLIWLRVSSPEELRRVRKLAPDLTVAIDLHAEIRAEVTEVDGKAWSSCRAHLRELMLERHRMLDFTGLLPASVDRTELPLEELYQPLVERSPASSTAEQLLFSALPQLDDDEPSQALLLLGHPGTGKTTYLRRLAVRYANGEDPLGQGRRVPLLLPLSDYGWEREQGRATSLIDYIPRWLEEQGVPGGESISEHLSQVLFLLDGLDELPSAQARRAVLDEVTQAQRRDQAFTAVLTGRSFLVDELRTREVGLRLISIRAPDQEEVRAFLRSFIRLRKGDEEHAGELIARIEGDDDLRALARTPLMLAFMAVLDELEGRLPDRRIEIYYRLAEMLVDRWTRARSLGNSGRQRERPTRADALRVLGPLAWWTIERGGGAVPENALFAEIERIEARREGPAEAKRRAQALLDLLRADTALLVPRPGRRWSFVHASIGEYFAGVEVERDRQRWRALLEDPFRPEWREVLLFCAGQLGVIDGRVDSLDLLVDAVLRRSRRSGRYDAKYPSLLIGLLREPPGLSHRQTARTIERLFEFIFTNAFSREAAHEAQGELLALFWEARPPVEELLQLGLDRWVSEDASRPRWSRIFYPPRTEDPESLREIPGSETLLRVAVRVLGRLTAFLIGIEKLPSLTLVRLDSARALWRKSPDWRFRFAYWLAKRSSPETLLRPYIEVADSLESFLAKPPATNEASKEAPRAEPPVPEQ